MYSGNCYGCCDPVAYAKKDKEALLKEQKAILEAKLATVNHMLESADSKDENDT